MGAFSMMAFFTTKMQRIGNEAKNRAENIVVFVRLPNGRTATYVPMRKTNQVSKEESVGRIIENLQGVE